MTASRMGDDEGVGALCAALGSSSGETRASEGASEGEGEGAARVAGAGTPRPA